MSNTPLNVKTFGYKEINQIDAQKKYINNINIFVKFFYLDINRKKIIESDIYILDKDFLKDKTVSIFEACKFAIQRIKVKHIFPHTIMSSFIYTDNKKTIPKQFVNKEIVSNKQKQMLLDFN